jgi:hypothetical protein
MLKNKNNFEIIHSFFHCWAENFSENPRMAHSYCMLDTKGYRHTHTHTHSEYVIFVAFPLQQWLYERASLLRYTYTACLSNLK